MGWFWRVSDASTAAELAAGLQRVGVLAQQLTDRQNGLELALKQHADEIGRELRGIVKEHQDDYGRVAAAIESLRQTVSGLRGGRPPKAQEEADRQALEFGRRVIQACATPEGALALAADLQAQAAAAGGGSPKVNVFGEPIRNGSRQP